MKRLAGLAIVCLLALATPLAYGDAIVQPNNDFWEQHLEQMVRLDREFVVFSATGSVDVQTAPDLTTVVKNLTSGDILMLDYTCLYDGSYWGYSLEHEGWIDMEQLRLLKDYADYYDEHQDEFYPYQGGLAAVQETGAALVWRWPGADWPLWTLSFDAETLTSQMISWAYRDADGRQWGFIDYYDGNQNFWICLSDPMNADIRHFDPLPEPTVWVPETPHINIPAPTNPTSPIIIVIVVVVLVVAAAGLILVAWKPKRAESNPTEEPSEELTA
ncbi:MAG: hypothetical protein LBE83_09685 [Propionibacteriaceae bacterium]|jgi:hypothetical protein|nr:hypothetical protein [Propionibacteriaceae bacterium]